MDFPSFFLGLLKEQTALLSAVAWPVAVVWIACLFRKEVRVLIGRVASIRSPFADVELKQELAQTQAAVANAVVKSDGEQTDVPTEQNEGPPVVPEKSASRDAPAAHTEDSADRDSNYLKWLAAYRRLNDGHNAKSEARTLIAQYWLPIERVVSDMYSFATGTAYAAGMTTSDKAIRLAKVGAINNAEAEALIELDALTGRLLLSKASLEELSALDKYARMAQSIRKLLIPRWVRLRNTQAPAGDEKAEQE